MARTKFSELREAVEARPRARQRLAAKRAETLEEVRLYELRHAQAVSQAELAGRWEVTQGAVSKLADADDVRVLTLRQYLDALGALAGNWSRCSTMRDGGCLYTRHSRRPACRLDRACSLLLLRRLGRGFWLEQVVGIVEALGDEASDADEAEVVEEGADLLRSCQRGRGHQRRLWLELR